MTAQGYSHEGRSFRSRRIALASFVLLFAGLTMVAGSADVSASGAELRKAAVWQKGRSVVVEVRTAREFALRRLERYPQVRRNSSRYLCLELRRTGQTAASRVCVGGRKQAHHAAGFARVGPSGDVRSAMTIPATVKRLSPRKLRISFVPGAAHVKPGRYSWRVLFSPGCGPNVTGCGSSVPGRGWNRYRVRPVDLVGCTGGNGQVVRRGPDGRRRVALTFDDGPSSYTSRILRILREKKARATFFMLGSLVAADPATARRALRQGHELANHSTSHALLPGYWDIKSASRTIRRTTGFRPCLFRPPYGALSGGVIDSVRRAGMKSVLWDVDTMDWSTPGSGSIYSSIVNGTRRGSIVLMHDGGGPRSQTVSALPGAISALRNRGYRFVTVTELLGNRFVYRPR
jgi:peptidoglycan-N-acetylglucosamine deacetylase